MSITRPVVNPGFQYINGMQLTWATADTVTVAAGQCRDSTDVNDIELAAAVTLDITLSGLNGLDTGAMANATIYALYAIGSSYGQAPSGVIISANHSQPVLPYNYDMYRRIGFVRSDGSAQILKFYQSGNGSDRWMHYDASIATDITAGASATYADVDCTGSVPLINTLIELDCTFTPTAANDELVVVPNGSTSTNGVNRMSGSAAGVIKIGHMTCPCQGDATLEYKVTGSAVALNVQGYLDVL